MEESAREDIGEAGLPKEQLLATQMRANRRGTRGKVVTGGKLTSISDLMIDIVEGMSQVPSIGKTGRPRKNLHGDVLTVMSRERKARWRRLSSQTELNMSSGIAPV